MGEFMVELRSSTAEPAAEASNSAPLPPPPPPAHPRRPRVREVSSRFMSPVVSSSSNSQTLSRPSSGDLLPSKSPLHKPYLGSSPTPNLAEQKSRERSSSVDRRRRQLDMEPLSCSDGNNRPADEHTVRIQSSDNPFPLEQVPASTLRRQRSVKLQKENLGNRPIPQKNSHGKGGAFSTPSRPDTPMLSSSFDRTISSSSTARFRLMQQRSNNMTSSAAAKLLQSSVMSLPSQSTDQVTQSSSQDCNLVSQDCHSLLDEGNHNRLSCSTQSLPELRSSMPETNELSTVSSRPRISNRGGAASIDSLKLVTFPPSRFLNSPFSSAADSSEKLVSAVSKSCASLAKMGGICLPPVPPCANLKSGTEMRKARKVPSHLEDIHSLKLLHNRYLQWRYANAKAEASVQAQQREAETKVNSLRVRISELYDSVTRKRIELGILRRTKALSAIVEAQVPYLDHWSTLEGDYSVSLAESIQALLNASIQLPLGANVRVDMKELQEALNSAMKVMETTLSYIQHLMPRAGETEILMSELAKITGGERALVEECGDMLTKTYALQVDECSLRGQILQFHRSLVAAQP